MTSAENVAGNRTITGARRVFSQGDYTHCHDEVWAGRAQPVQRLAMGWTVRGSNPGGGEISRTCPDLPWSPPSLLYNGYRVFSRGLNGRSVALTTHPI